MGKKKDDEQTSFSAVRVSQQLLPGTSWPSPPHHHHCCHGDVARCLLATITNSSRHHSSPFSMMAANSSWLIAPSWSCTN